MLVADICKYIRENINNNISLDDLAHHFAYSKYHLSRTFKKETGYSFKQYMEALKIEKSIEAILNDDKNITRVFIESSYESNGTFSNTFKRLTGLSPYLYKKSVPILYSTLINMVKKKGEIEYRSSSGYGSGRLSVNLHYPNIHNERVSFVGLFNNGIPNSPPVVGVAMYKHTRCVLDFIPQGNYHLLVTEIDLKSEVSNYFLLNNSYRAKLDYKLEIKDNSDLSVDLSMRLPIAEDPPIIINLPNLVKEALLKKINK